MAFLQRALRSWKQSVRLLATEAQMSAAVSEMQSRLPGRAAPILKFKSHNFALNEWLREDKMPKAEEFAASRQEFLSSKDFAVTEDTVDMIIVNLCLHFQRINTAIAYLRYLWDNKADVKISAMATYLKLHYIRESQQLDETDQRCLLDCYDRVIKKNPLLDAETAECCILGVSLTERWKETFAIMDMIKLSSKPKCRAYSAIITAAFNKNEPEYGWKYLEEIIVTKNPDNRVYHAYLAYCKRNFQGEELENKIGKMFKFWGDFDVRPYVKVIDAYVATFRDIGWEAEQTSIRGIGICRSCSHRLPNFQLLDEEYDKLARVVHDRAIVGNDVYQKTTPKELKYFLRFMKESKPWDVVIDGLNVGHLTKSKHASGHLVKSAVMHCAEMGKKVLVLGRKHMAKWPKLDFSYIKQVADVFLAENGTSDDAYLLYATLCSGSATMFVSRDLMRQHKFLLEDPDITRIFKNWQITHQLYPTAITSKNGTLEIKLINPPKYLPLVQKAEDGWHVPFTFNPSLNIVSEYSPTKSWYCLRKKKKA